MGWNDDIIEEFRANQGRVGGRYESQPLLLLHQRGAKSGIERVNPVGFLGVGDAYAVFGTNAGKPSDPNWYRNLIANPRARIEVGTETLDVMARVAEGDERDQLWERQKQRNPAFAGYEEKAGRQIPVVVLEPVRSSS